MCMETAGMAKRINVILPESTLRAIDRLAKPGERSRLIDKAVQHYVMTRSAEGICQQLTKAAIRDRDLDLEVASEWAAVDQESWQQDIDPEAKREGSGRGAAKSISRRSIRR
jgi:CopG family transcriptional regulator / antitoxin EndoAI